MRAAGEKMTMHLRTLLALGLLTAALGACDHRDRQAGSAAFARFQMAVGTTDTFLIDSVTGDLWKLEESPGDEPARWIRYGDAPDDAKPLAQLLHPERPPNP
jgi:hypothetical protein